MKIGQIIIAILLLTLVACKSNSQSQKIDEDVIVQENSIDTTKLKFPKPIGYVSDFENIFTEQQINELERIITDYEKRTTREIAIVSTSSIMPYDNFKDYGKELSNEWGIGKAEKDNGLLILLSANLKEIRITTGLGTEKVLTDDICEKLIDETLIADLKKGQYYIGIKRTMLGLIEKWK